MPTSVLRLRQHAPQGRWVAGELVGDDHPRRVVPAFHRPSYEGFGRVLIPPALHENVDNEAVLVHRPPQPVPPAVDLQRYFVQVQLVARAASTPPQVSREYRAERAHPLADCLIGHRHAPFRQELLHVPQAE